MSGTSITARRTRTKKVSTLGRGLRRIYALFLVEKAATSHDVEKQSKKNALLTMDRLLSAKRPGHRRSARLRQWKRRLLRRAW